MDKSMKVLVAVLVFLYILSPIDFMPGCPLDDILVFLFSFASQKKLPG